jgi:hypothetical protein
MTRHRAGLATLVLSTALSFAVLAVPFVEAPADGKVASAAGLYGLSWALFGVSGWLLGPETMQRIRGLVRRRRSP